MRDELDYKIQIGKDFMKIAGQRLSKMMYFKICILRNAHALRLQYHAFAGLHFCITVVCANAIARGAGSLEFCRLSHLGLHGITTLQCQWNL